MILVAAPVDDTSLDGAVRVFRVLVNIIIEVFNTVGEGQNIFPSYCFCSIVLALLLLSSSVSSSYSLLLIVLLLEG